MPDIYTSPGPQNPNVPSLQYRLATAIDALRGRIPAPAKVATPSAPEPPPQVKVGSDPEGRAFADANYVAAYYRNFEEIFKGGVTRQARYQDYTLMDTDVIAAMLDAVVDACLVSDDGSEVGFKVEAKAKYQNIIDGIISELDLTAWIREILRETLKYGDNFVGAVFDEYWNIRDYDNPPPNQMWAFTDQHLRLLSGSELVNGVRMGQAYQQKTAALSTVAGWYPWEMFHLKYWPAKRALYSTKSFLEDIRPIWYKLKVMDEAIVINRMTRAFPRGLHTLDMTGKAAEEARAAMDGYVRDFTKKKLTNNEYVRDTPAVDEDIFLSTGYRTGPDGKLYPNLNNVQLLDPRNTALKMDDVNYLSKKLFARVTSELVGILPDRNDISMQDIAMGRFFAYCQSAILERQLLRPLFNLGLALKGYRPQPDDYRIIFPSVQMRASWKYADASFRQSMSDGNSIEQGLISRKYVAQQKYGLSDADWEAMKAEIKKERDEIGDIPRGTNAGLQRVGNNSA